MLNQLLDAVLVPRDGALVRSALRGEMNGLMYFAQTTCKVQGGEEAVSSQKINVSYKTIVVNIYTSNSSIKRTVASSNMTRYVEHTESAST